MPNNRILVVDDEPFNLEIMNEILGEQYSLTLVENGEKALGALAAEEKFDLVLLDVSMPGIDGYQVCREIRAGDKWKDLPVVFVSARGSVDERMEGFNVGGDDYIVKPFQEQEITTKVARILELQQNNQKLASSLSEATKTAMEAMSGSSEMGAALLFIERSHEKKTASELASLMNEACMSLGLNSTVFFPGASEQKFFARSGEMPSPLECELIDRIKDKERIFSFEQRTQFNFDEVSVLVKNMPIEDENKYGRYKDLLPLVISAINAQAKSLINEETVAEHKQVKQVISDVNSKLNNLGTRIESSQDQFKMILDKMQSTLEQQIPYLGLDDDQEKFLVDLVDSNVQKAQKVADNNEEINETFQNVFEVLKTISQ